MLEVNNDNTLDSQLCNGCCRARAVVYSWHVAQLDGAADAARDSLYALLSFPTSVVTNYVYFVFVSATGSGRKFACTELIN